jgi:glyoxylase-like metal-dependent hydrolase (beta-lactamase superfamily II)
MPTVEVAPGIHRIGAKLINAYVVEESGSVTIVDAGLGGYWRDLQTGLTDIGRTIVDVKAVVLTHGHDDHIGFAERIRKERGTPVHIHEADAGRALGEKPPKNKGHGPAQPLAALAFLIYAARNGLIRTKHLGEVSTFGDGATLDVPGSPRVIHVPGHTAGSAAIHLPSRDAILVGDALVTLNVMSGKTGPQMFPNFDFDSGQAFESLKRLDGIEASHVLPGHGEAWTGGLAEALRLIRATRA